jgi:hypothetical protein
MARAMRDAMTGFPEGLARSGADARRVAALIADPMPPAEAAALYLLNRKTRWAELDLEPLAHITRVRSTDGLTVAIRGAECWWEGEGYSNWAYILADGRPRTPGPDSSVPEDTGWYCWLDLDFTGRLKWVDDTASDSRRASL